MRSKSIIIWTDYVSRTYHSIKLSDKLFLNYPTISLKNFRSQLSVHSFSATIYPCTRAFPCSPFPLSLSLDSDISGVSKKRYNRPIRGTLQLSISLSDRLSKRKKRKKEKKERRWKCSKSMTRESKKFIRSKKFISFIQAHVAIFPWFRSIVWGSSSRLASWIAIFRKAVAAREQNSARRNAESIRRRRWIPFSKSHKLLEKYLFLPRGPFSTASYVRLVIPTNGAERGEGKTETVNGRKKEAENGEGGRRMRETQKKKGARRRTSERKA